ncbi:CRISPR-associated protein Cas10/Csm1, subtype III-A/MTUBE [Aedoeadaptatus ivorii]|uniref:CRISPR system single-strand-specific deoxyribonuclease Cas10/Csm1 (subtype III-A) n=1 Tax=Aedoeadaptatus ivorii TaxID=54006 RepID=A0A3S5AIB6_9FIRM|nr:type III-A CRISPR-associated protein Cas10/Csm1 [Peptoniphilus ivorii]VEJ34613.1 CRISPR-associated protein Cas10/Csm1, subtype III-A/MTUBE [Peptoniphilus ivorii]
MEREQFNLILGCLLHDLGKILYRYDDPRKHAKSGGEFLQEHLHIDDPTVREMVLYHHSDALRRSGLARDHFAYISYIADNIAAFSDRRGREGENKRFLPDTNLESIFNILNGNNRRGVYPATMLDSNAPIFPQSQERGLDREFYGKVVDRVRDNLAHLSQDFAYLQSYLEVVEATMSFVPSSTNTAEFADISLFDHLKLTTAYGAAIYAYLQECGEKDYRARLLDGAEDFYEEEAFLLVSLDMSGIQKFIYRIIKKGALKSLRARSFYLDIMLEVIVDEILARLDLIRANLLYIGGGGAYLLLPNTEETKRVLEAVQKEVNGWFMQEFSTQLYLTLAYTPAAANHFRNVPEGSYGALFRTLSEKISAQKLKRYTYRDIVAFNEAVVVDGDRECKNCNRTDHLTEEGICEMCADLQQVSAGIFERDFFLFTEEKLDKTGLAFPFGQWMYPVGKRDLAKYMESGKAYVRAYAKNEFYTGDALSTNLWVGDYHYNKFTDQLSRGEGIERIGVLRADVDNLGQTFVKGFERNGNTDLVTLSRTSTLSRVFSNFFKSNINHILEHPEYRFRDGEIEPRKCNIIYSGGDDIFLIGHWADVIEFAVDLQRAFRRFTEDSVTISAGIGIYASSYPISHMAEETGELESAAKAYIDRWENPKNAVCLFEENMAFSWEEFTENVIGEKYDLLKRYFHAMYPDDVQSGHSALYQILYYLREIEDKINFARILYLLSRKKPKEREARAVQQELIQKLYEWLKIGEERKALEMAMILLVYENRGDNDVQ